MRTRLLVSAAAMLVVTPLLAAQAPSTTVVPSGTWTVVWANSPNQTQTAELKIIGTLVTGTFYGSVIRGDFSNGRLTFASPEVWKEWQEYVIGTDEQAEQNEFVNFATVNPDGSLTGYTDHFLRGYGPVGIKRWSWKASRSTQAVGASAQAQASVSLADVAKAPAKFAGQKACWIGQINSALEVQVGGDRFELQSSNWMAVDDKGNPVRELVFVVDEKSAKKTPAAVAYALRSQEDRGQFLVCGVINGTKEADLNIDGKSKIVVAPLLSNATIDVRPSKVG